MVKNDVLPEKKPPRPPNKKERLAIIMGQISKWLDTGLTPQEIAEEKLSEKQWDFLVDMGVDTDSFVLTAEQKKHLRQITTVKRQSGLTYNKKYPQTKQDLYKNLLDFLITQNADIAQKERENFRDIDFNINGTAYKIVLSNPRPPKTKI